MFLKRLIQIIWIAFPLLLKKEIKVDNQKIALTGPVRLRMFFERAGGAFIKLGQILALRQDFLSFRYTNELLKLLSQTQPVPYEEMQRVFVEEKGIIPEIFFAEFDSNPVATASIGQVYKAKLKDGSLVAVKIQKPKSRKIFESDFRAMFFLAFFVDLFRIFSSVYAQEVVSEFISWTRHELDFRIEAQNANILYEHSRNHPKTFVPRQYLSLTSQRILIQEFIGDGISLENLLYKKTSLNFSFNDRERESLANYLVADIMRQYFIDGFFHADPHPANLIFFPPDKLIYLDFGIIGKSESQRLPYLKILYGVTKNDSHYISNYLMEFGEKLMSEELENYLKRASKREKTIFDKVSTKVKEIILEDLEKDIKAILDDWIKSINKPNSSLRDKSASSVFLKLVSVAEKYSVHLPKEIILHFRMLSILDMIALQLSESFDMMKALKYFFDNYTLEDIEGILQEGYHFEERKEIIGINQNVDWELFREMAVFEKERRTAAKEKFVELVLYYAEQDKALRSMIKKIKI